MNADGESVSDDRLTTSTGYKQNYKVLKDVPRRNPTSTNSSPGSTGR